MSARNYGEYCGLAHALELVGERWGLLVIRELLDRPEAVHRPVANGLHRIPSNVLSARLKELEQHGVVERRVLPRPSGAVVYALTDYGRELDEVLIRLAGWGARSAGEPREGDAVSGDRARARTARDLPARGRRATCRRPTSCGSATSSPTPASPAASSRSPKARPPDPDLTIEADTVPASRADRWALGHDRARPETPALFERFAEIFRIEQVPGTPVSEEA